MIQVETLPDMSDFMDRQQLVGWIVRDEIMRSGISYSEAARRWPISLPTLNRLMYNGNVGLRFYRVAERGLGLPDDFFDLVLDGDIEAIRKVPGISETLREHVLRGLDAPPSPAKRTPRKRAQS